MTTYAAEDFEAIRRRVEELKAERDLALTGSSVPTTVGEYAIGWPYTAADDSYSPSGFNEAARQYMKARADCWALTSAPVFNLPDLRGRVKSA